MSSVTDRAGKINRSIYKRKTIIGMKIQKSVTFNDCSVYLFHLNPSVIASYFFCLERKCIVITVDEYKLL